MRRQQILRAAYEVAAREGLDGLTIRDVAAKAGLSSGLVLFHFETKARLLLALLDWVLETTTVLHVTPDIAQIPSPLDRLTALLQREMNRLSSEPRRIRVFFDFWARGIRNAQIRSKKYAAELDRYREAFRPIAVEVLRAESERFAHVSADGARSRCGGLSSRDCAVQAMVDPQFDIKQFLAAAQGLVGQLAPSFWAPLTE